MPTKPMNTLEVPTLPAWRAWLERHHAGVTDVWLIFHKVHTGRPCIAYEDAIEDALCYGWVDSLVKRLDDDRFARKFTPRKADSLWSDSNRKRYARLEAAGRLQAAGLARRPTRGKYATPPVRPARMPGWITDALRARPAARRTFDALSETERRRYVHWIHAAKRQETKDRRVREAIALLAAGKPLGLK
jgi:uncharacterized protein YdeI (YjbR/CyaY-like superfamily)